MDVVQIDRPELDTDRDDVREAAPWTKTLISFVIRMNRENIRSPMRSLANVEFHASDDHKNGVFSAQTDVVERIGGQPPQSLEDFVRTQRDMFTGGSAFTEPTQPSRGKEVEAAIRA